MKVILTVEQLREALVGLNREDSVVINIHDMELQEDNYTFYVDIINLNGSGAGKHEVQLCPIKNI